LTQCFTKILIWFDIDVRILKWYFVIYWKFYFSKNIIFLTYKNKKYANVTFRNFVQVRFIIGRMRITEDRLHVLLRTARESCYQDTTKVVVLCGTCIYGEHGRVSARGHSHDAHIGAFTCLRASAFMRRIEYKPQRSSFVCLARAILKRANIIHKVNRYSLCKPRADEERDKEKCIMFRKNFFPKKSCSR